MISGGFSVFPGASDVVIACIVGEEEEVSEYDKDADSDSDSDSDSDEDRDDKDDTDGCAFIAVVLPSIPAGFAAVVAIIVIECVVVFAFLFGRTTALNFFCFPKEDEDEDEGAVSRPADGFDLPSLLGVRDGKKSFELRCCGTPHCCTLCVFLCC